MGIALNNRKLIKVFKAKGIDIWITKSARPIPEGCTLYNLSRPLKIQVGYVATEGRVLLIHNKEVSKYFRYISNLQKGEV